MPRSLDGVLLEKFLAWVERRGYPEIDTADWRGGSGTGTYDYLERAGDNKDVAVDFDEADWAASVVFMSAAGADPGEITFRVDEDQQLSVSIEGNRSLVTLNQEEASAMVRALIEELAPHLVDED